MRVKRKLKLFDDVTKEDVDKIHNLMKKGMKIKDILKEMKISQPTMDKIFSRYKKIN
tara:strand:- start:27 stop:197 length:171 start_codon:yes stop_codon:yes gene_type:complete